MQSLPNEQGREMALNKFWRALMAACRAAKEAGLSRDEMDELLVKAKFANAEAFAAQPERARQALDRLAKLHRDQDRDQDDLSPRRP